MPDRVEMFRRLERQFFRDQLGALGLQHLDGLVIYWVGRAGGMRQEDLAPQLVVDKGAVARSLARLEGQSLVERQVSAQCRREKQVALTAAGERTFGRIQQIVRTWQEVKYRGFTPEEREMNEAFLTRIAENVMDFRREEERRHG